jgi:hypothetical protein
MAPTIPKLTRIGATHAPQISATWDAKLELDGFEPASIAKVTPKHAEVYMRLVQREPLDRGEEDG